MVAMRIWQQRPEQLPQIYMTFVNLNLILFQQEIPFNSIIVLDQKNIRFITAVNTMIFLRSFYQVQGMRRQPMWRWCLVQAFR